MELLKWALLALGAGGTVVGVMEVVERAAQSTIAILSGVLGLIVGSVVVGGLAWAAGRRRLLQAEVRATTSTAQQYAASLPYAHYQQPTPPVIVVPQAYQPAAPPALFERGLNEVGGNWTSQAATQLAYTQPARGDRAAEVLPPRINWDIL